MHHQPTPSHRPAAAPRQQRFDRTGKLLLAAIGASVAMLVFGTAGLVWLWQGTPDLQAIKERVDTRPSRIISSDGVLLDTIGANQSVPVAMDQVAPAIIDALLATEDRRFYEHGAIDPRRMLAATFRTLRGDLQGASTLTQQLARNLFPRRIGSERSILRKLREIAVAIKIEQAYTKPQILALYLNRVPYRYDVVGIEMAARTYFSKPAAEVDTHEAALLVAMLKGPSYFDPERQPQRAKERRDLVLGLMARQGHIDKDLLTTARSRGLDVKLTRHDIDPPLAPHYLRVVRGQAADWAAQRGLDPQRDGLTIQVGLDSRLQRVAEQAVERQGEILQAVAQNEWSDKALRVGPARNGSSKPAFDYFWQRQPELMRELLQQTPAFKLATESGADISTALDAARADPAVAGLKTAKTRLEAGFVAIEPASGSVRAYVGSRSWKHDRFDHVSQARRQPGSTFKPFVYGAALEAGMPQNRMFFDAPFTLTMADGRSWTPGDVGPASGELMMMRTGLWRSKNTITAQVMNQVGANQVVRYARALGISHSSLDPVPSLALGTSPVTLLEMANAYNTLAALGVRRESILIESISDRNGREIARFGGQPVRVVEGEHAATMVDILREAVDRGTGTLLRSEFGLKSDIAGKTGTTQNNTDGWFISLQPGLVTGAWVGFNDQRVTMRSSRWGQGGHSALRLVGDFLRDAGKLELIDSNARFPDVERPRPPVTWALDQRQNGGDGVDLPLVDDAIAHDPADRPERPSLIVRNDSTPWSVSNSNPWFAPVSLGAGDAAMVVQY